MAVWPFLCCYSSWMILKPCVCHDLIVCLTPAHKIFTILIEAPRPWGPKIMSSHPLPTLASRFHITMTMSWDLQVFLCTIQFLIKLVMSSSVLSVIRAKTNINVMLKGFPSIFTKITLSDTGQYPLMHCAVLTSKRLTPHSCFLPLE